MMQSMLDRENRVRVKICGITDVATALSCLDLGADAIGLVFYPKSPRHVSEDTARAICEALDGRIPGVGVFVNESPQVVRDRARRCGLGAVQLHGGEPPETVAALRSEGLVVIKALFHGKTLNPETAGTYRACAFLAECGGGVLPGGNAMDWDWAKAKGVSGHVPLVLAGGLTPENVQAAITLGMPDAVDVSSGVEASPGVKDLKKVAAFIRAVAAYRPSCEIRKIF